MELVAGEATLLDISKGFYSNLITVINIYSSKLYLIYSCKLCCFTVNYCKKIQFISILP